MVKFSLQKVVKFAKLFSTVYYKNLYWVIKFYDMEPNILIYALNELIVIYRKVLQNYTHYR